MDKKAYIYRSDSNNNMKLICSGVTKEDAKKKLLSVLGDDFDINWTDVKRTDPQAGMGMWYGVIVDKRRYDAVT